MKKFLEFFKPAFLPGLTVVAGVLALLLRIILQATGIDEKGYDAETGKMLVCVNPQWFRPTDVDNLWGDPTKAKTVLSWNPQKTSYAQLVEIMAKHDRMLAKQEKAMKEAK